MSGNVETNGSCLCGAVSIEVKTLNLNVGACHCSMCQKWTGGPLMAVDCGTQVEFAQTEQVTIFDSSAWAERGFCQTCGSHLYYKIKQSGQYIMPVGLFDQGLAFNFDHQVFIDEKPSYYCFAEKTKDMTGAEVFAMFSENSD